MSQKSNPTSVQLSAFSHMLLKKISTFTGKSQSAIIEEFVRTLYISMQKDIQKVVSTGDFVSYNLNVTSGIRADMVSNQFTVPMSMSFEESDKIRDSMIEQQFAELDQLKEQRKKEFSNN
jgi:protein involved in ribonucleotide reduction